MNCEETIRRLPDRDDDLLEADAARALDEHLAGCATCAKSAAGA